MVGAPTLAVVKGGEITPKSVFVFTPVIFFKAIYTGVVTRAVRIVMSSHEQKNMAI